MKRSAFLIAACFATVSSAAVAQQPSFSKGLAETTDANLFECGDAKRVSKTKDRISPVGTIRSEDGKMWVVPADTLFKTGPKATDLLNECAGNIPNNTSEVDLAKIPVIDAGGSEVFTAYLFADNYFELHVNGKLLAIDPIPFTPFNSSIVRFKADRPVTMALKLVDWEENLALGSEANPSTNYHAGDAGITVHVKDDAGKTVAISDESWRAQTFYTAPLRKKSCLKVDGQNRDSSACDSSDAEDGSEFYAAHWPLPDNWSSSDFDDSAWPMAKTYTNEIVDVRNKPAFLNFPDIFDTPGADAQFIWTSNLVLDNLVLARKVIN